MNLNCQGGGQIMASHHTGLFTYCLWMLQSYRAGQLRQNHMDSKAEYIYYLDLYRQKSVGHW